MSELWYLLLFSISWVVKLIKLTPFSFQIKIQAFLWHRNFCKLFYCHKDTHRQLPANRRRSWQHWLTRNFWHVLPVVKCEKRNAKWSVGNCERVKLYPRQGLNVVMLRWFVTRLYKVPVQRALSNFPVLP